jgi:carboxypeptidase family protein
MRAVAGFGRRLMHLGLVISLSGIPLTYGQAGMSAGFLAGRIFVADGVTPRAGVVVKAANLSTSQVFTSAQTDRSGRYTFTGLPSGQYQVVVQTGEGLYVNQDKVPVLQGRKTLFSLALNPGAALQEPPPAQEPPPPANPPAQEPPPANPPAQEPPPAETPKPEETKPEDTGKKEKTPAEKEAAEKSQKGKGTGFWRSGWGVAIGLGGGALVLGLLADQIAGSSSEVQQPPSPSTPTP